MEYFVKQGSIVRKIWSDTDCILFIFGAAAGEFALHKSVDWLFFTGKLPNDPIGRLFSTIVYAQKIIFEEKEKAEMTLQYMKNIHKNVENARGYEIPNWAYQDVLYMLIAYTISAYELLNHALLFEEKEEVYTVFKEVGIGMGIEILPDKYQNWQNERKKHLINNYTKSEFSGLLFDSYKKNLGKFRYFLLLEVQKMLLEPELKKLQTVSKKATITPILQIYKRFKNQWPFREAKYFLLPMPYSDMLRKISKKTYQISY